MSINLVEAKNVEASPGVMSKRQVTSHSARGACAASALSDLLCYRDILSHFFATHNLTKDTTLSIGIDSFTILRNESKIFPDSSFGTR